MKKTVFSFLFLLLSAAVLSSFTAPQQGEKRYALYGVAFYNLENLFDTLHDAGKNDYEFLPCLLYTSPSPRDTKLSRMPSSA